MATRTINGVEYKLVQLPASRRGRAAINWPFSQFKEVTPISPSHKPGEEQGIYAKQVDKRLSYAHAGNLNPKLRNHGLKLIVRTATNGTPKQFKETIGKRTVTTFLVNYGSASKVPAPQKRTRKPKTEATTN